MVSGPDPRRDERDEGGREDQAQPDDHGQALDLCLDLLHASQGPAGQDRPGPPGQYDQAIRTPARGCHVTRSMPARLAVARTPAGGLGGWPSKTPLLATIEPEPS